MKAKKNIIVGIVIVLTISYGVLRTAYEARKRDAPNHLDPLANKDSIRYLNILEVKRCIEDRSATLIDVRQPVFYQSGHISDAIDLPLRDLESGSKNSIDRVSLMKSAQIIVYCSDRECSDAEEAALILIRNGVRNVGVYKGGWLEWAEDAR